MFSKIFSIRHIMSLLFLALQAPSSWSTAVDVGGSGESAPRISMQLPTTTQGPFWPPAAVMDENGDFIVVGTILKENENGTVVPIPGSAAIVSKNTIPPLDKNGQEDFSDPFASPYTIVRNLDLSEGSKDLNLTLYTSSYSPATCDTCGPRIPKAGNSDYNLNGFNIKGENCPELFPSASQRQSYARPSFPLHEAPIWGFQGDNIRYNVDTGEPETVQFRNGADCPSGGCLGEDQFHKRRESPITLGEWLKAKVYLTITLRDWDPMQKSYTAAEFFINAEGLLPNSIYTAVAIRESFLRPSPLLKLPTPATPAAHIITDERGKGQLRFIMENPFPAPGKDSAGLRVIGLGLAYKSDFAIYGACSLRFGAGVDIHAVAVSTADGVFDFTDFITVEPQK